MELVGPRADGIFFVIWDAVEVSEFWGPSVALRGGFVDEGADLGGNGGESPEFVALLEGVFGEFFLGDVRDHHEEACGFSVGGIDASDFPVDELGSLCGLEVADGPSLEVVWGTGVEGFWGEGEDLLREFGDGGMGEEVGEGASFEVVEWGAEDGSAGVVGA